MHIARASLINKQPLVGAERTPEEPLGRQHPLACTRLQLIVAAVHRKINAKFNNKVSLVPWFTVLVEKTRQEQATNQANLWLSHGAKTNR